jgi:DNA-directed RNA polymerase specialized sigma24 family protein
VLNDLPERQREAFVLYYGEGHSQVTCAEYMGISQPSFCGLLGKAKKRLAKMGLPVHEEHLGGKVPGRFPSIYDLDIT